MTRLVEVNGHVAVAGLSWRNYVGSTAKGIDAKEQSFHFDGVAYLKGKDPEARGKKGDSSILAAGYVHSQELLSSEDAPEPEELLRKPSLMLWFIEQAKRNGLDQGEGVSGIFQVYLGNSRYWLAGIKGSKPLPFHATVDRLVPEDQVHAALKEMKNEASDSKINLEVHEINADDFFTAKPSKNVGKVVKGRGISLAAAFQSIVIILMIGAVGWMTYDMFFKEEPAQANTGPSPAQLQNRAFTAYQAAMQRDFGWTSSTEALDAVLGVLENVPVAAGAWDFTGVSCKGIQESCIFQFASPGYGAPSVLEAALSSPVEASLGGREALFRKPLSLRTEVARDFSVPKSGTVRNALLDAAALLRSPAFELTVELAKPEQISIENGSFLRDPTFSATYMKGGLSVTGALGFIEVAANALDLPGVVITEVIINNGEFAMRGHYAFN